MKEELINKKIDEVMQSIDGIQPASPRPFLFTRLEARMQNEKNAWSRLSSFVSRPIVAFACMGLVLMINAMVIFFSNTSGNLLAQQGSELSAADEYNQMSYNLYDFENTKP